VVVAFLCWMGGQAQTRVAALPDDVAVDALSYPVRWTDRTIEAPDALEARVASRPVGSSVELVDAEGRTVRIDSTERLYSPWHIWITRVNGLFFLGVSLIVFASRVHVVPGRDLFWACPPIHHRTATTTTTARCSHAYRPDDGRTRTGIEGDGTETMTRSWERSTRLHEDPLLMGSLSTDDHGPVTMRSRHPRFRPPDHESTRRPNRMPGYDLRRSRRLGAARYEDWNGRNDAISPGTGSIADEGRPATVPGQGSSPGGFSS